jgi:phosphopantothenoylcysteine decarboxylase/phosphopantothenate--cysteine ligase
MTNPIADRTLLLGVTGSIACYKAADLASRLAQAGAQVDVILTPAAAQFVAPLTFQSVTGRRAYVEADLWGSQGHVLHIGLARAAHLLVIAPASANTLAKLAHGVADTLLTLTALAADCPLLLAPAMDGGMYAHPATQNNLRLLQERGARLIGPAEGRLASGLSGPGRMVEPVDILGQIRLALAAGGPLSGRRVIVTAGGTQEPLDPVRVLTNRSSGKQGFALAQAALDLGAQVTLISAPAALPTPTGARRVEVETAEEMLRAVLDALPGSDLLLMAAAVADFRPRSPAAHKIKKEGGIPAITLEKAPDILAAVTQVKAHSGFPRLVVGFAAESQDLLANAAAKLNAKQLDLIAANDISAQDSGFAVDHNRVTLLYPSGNAESLPLMDKSEVAAIIVSRAAGMLPAR